jgi:hypothetical protein
MNPRWGQFFMTQRGQFRMAFDTGSKNRCAESDIEDRDRLNGDGR